MPCFSSFLFLMGDWVFDPLGFLDIRFLRSDSGALPETVGVRPALESMGTWKT